MLKVGVQEGVSPIRWRQFPIHLGVKHLQMNDIAKGVAPRRKTECMVRFLSMENARKTAKAASDTQVAHTLPHTASDAVAGPLRRKAGHSGTRASEHRSPTLSVTPRFGGS